MLWCVRATKVLAFPLEIQYPDKVTAPPKVMLLIRLTRPENTGGFAMAERNGAISVPPDTWGPSAWIRTPSLSNTCICITMDIETKYMKYIVYFEYRTVPRPRRVINGASRTLRGTALTTQVLKSARLSKRPPSLSHPIPSLHSSGSPSLASLASEASKVLVVVRLLVRLWSDSSSESHFSTSSL